MNAHRRTAILVLGLGVLGLALWFRQASPPRLQTAAKPACKSVQFEGNSYRVCTYDRQRHRLSILVDGRDKRPLRGFDRLASSLGADAARIAFAVNGGMFDTSGSPIGLWIAGGIERHEVNTEDGPGNFHLKPNGVFRVTDGEPWVGTTEAYLADPVQPDWATQSGPMLVSNGTLHPAITDNGPSRYIRNGVGVDGGGRAVFAISDSQVSFGSFARLYRDKLGCRDALYFDGFVSSIWDPPGQYRKERAALGPIIVVLEN